VAIGKKSCFYLAKFATWQSLTFICFEIDIYFGLDTKPKWISVSRNPIWISILKMGIRFGFLETDIRFEFQALNYFTQSLI